MPNHMRLQLNYWLHDTLKVYLWDGIEASIGMSGVARACTHVRMHVCAQDTSLSSYVSQFDEGWYPLPDLHEFLYHIC